MAAGLAIGCGGFAFYALPRLREPAPAPAAADPAREEALARARVHLESGRRCVEQLRLRMTREYEPADLAPLGDQAVREFEKALATVPDHPEAHLGISRVHQLSGRRDLALDSIAKALRVAPELAPAYLDRVRIRIDEYERLRHLPGGGSFRETPESEVFRKSLEEDLAQAERHAGRQADRLYAEGLLAFCAARYDVAGERLKEFLTYAPSDGRAHYWRGHALYHLGRHAESEAELDLAIASDARDVDALDYRGLVRIATGRDLDAVADYDRATRIAPDRGELYLNRSLACIHLGRYAEGERDAASALARNPRWPEAHNNRAVALAHLRRMAEARGHWEEALGLRPDYASAYCNRGWSYYIEGNFDRAIADYTLAIEKDPDYGEAYRNRGVAWMDRGDLRKAILDLTEAIRLNPKDARNYSDRGIAKAQVDDLDGAMKDWDQAIEVDPRNPDAHANRGKGWFLKGEKAKAIADLRKALDVAPAGWAYREQTRSYLEEVQRR